MKLSKIPLLGRIVIAIILGIILGQFMPMGFARVFATFNDLFGSFLSFIIPLIIVGLVAPAIGELGKDHVLFFFYRSDCPYCHAFAPTLEAFQVRHGIQVVAISVDGGPITGFPNARPDNGIATALKVSQVPAVFLAQPFTGKITPIGFGVLSESQMLERIALVTGPRAEALSPGEIQDSARPQEVR